MTTFPKPHAGTPLTAGDYNLSMPFASLTALLAHPAGYAAASGYDAVSAGSRFWVIDRGFRYEVAASSATDHHLTTSGGLKLYAMTTPDGFLHIDAFGAVANDSTDAFAAIKTAITASVVGTGTALKCRPIRFGLGKYYCSATIEVKVPVRFTGVGKNDTEIRFPVNTPGIRFDPRGAWRGKRLYRFLTNAVLLAGGNPVYFGFPLNYAPSDASIPFAEVGGHVVCDTGEYYLIAASGASDHTHTSGAVKLYLQVAPSVVPNAVTQAAGASVEHMTLVGGGTNTADRTCHGIKMQTAIDLRHIRCEYFGGDGVNITATVDGLTVPGVSYGNANNFTITDLTVRYNGRDGLAVSGADANAGDVYGLDSALNSRFGLFEYSFLGNNYFGNHLDGNGTPGNMGAVPGGNGTNQTSIATFAGSVYSPHPLASLAQLVATQPDDATLVLPTTEGGSAALPVWIRTGPTPGSTFARAWTAGQPEGTFVLGGSYVMYKPTQANALFGLYEENGASGRFISGNNMGFGGIVSTKSYGDIVGGRDGNKLVTPYLTIEEKLQIKTTFGGDNGAFGPMMRSFVGPNEVQPWRECIYNGDYILFHQNSTSRMARFMTGEDTLKQFGTGAAVPYVMGFKQIALGPSGSERLMTYGSAAPTTGAHGRGERVYILDAVAGGFEGWVCVTAGTPGTWRTFGAISASAALFSQPYPWENLNLHAALNEWVEEQDLQVPEEWFQFTIAKKKEFLVQEYGE